MLFVLVSITATFLTVTGLSNSLNAVISSQRDAVEQSVIKNNAELISIIITANQCQVVAQFDGVSRDAVAMASSDSHLPTLQR